MVKTAAKRWGRLDYTANCAGICGKIWDEEESVTTELVDRSVNPHGGTLLLKLSHLPFDS